MRRAAVLTLLAVLAALCEAALGWPDTVVSVDGDVHVEEACEEGCADGDGAAEQSAGIEVKDDSERAEGAGEGADAADGEASDSTQPAEERFEPAEAPGGDGDGAKEPELTNAERFKAFFEVDKERLRGPVAGAVPAERDAPLYHFRSDHTSIKCYGETTDNRTCLVTNFCFVSAAEDYLFYAGDEETKLRMENQLKKWNGLLGTESSVEGLYPVHPKILAEPFPDDLPPTGTPDRHKRKLEHEFSFFVRSHIDELNMYHMTHDDIVPLFHTMSFFKPDVEEYYGTEYTGRPEGQRPIDKRAKIFHVDWSIDNLRDPVNGKSVFTLYPQMTDKAIARGGRHQPQVRANEHFGREATCFRAGVVGLTMISRTETPGWWWPPRGYYHNDGMWMTMAADYFLMEMGLPPTAFTTFAETPTVEPARHPPFLDEEGQAYLNGWHDYERCSEEYPCVVSFITRKRTRRILNEEELVAAIEALPIIEKVNIIDEEGMHFFDIAKMVRNSDILMGVHGGGMHFGIFLPVGGTVFEMWGFGVQPEEFHYMYQMFGTPNSGKLYVEWQNEHGELVFKPTSGRPVLRPRGLLVTDDKEELIECLRMPIKQHPYTWNNKCLNYWKDHDNIFPPDEIIDQIKTFRNARRYDTFREYLE